MGSRAMSQARGDGRLWIGHACLFFNNSASNLLVFLLFIVLVSLGLHIAWFFSLFFRIWLGDFCIKYIFVCPACPFFIFLYWP